MELISVRQELNRDPSEGCQAENICQSESHVSSLHPSFSLFPANRKALGTWDLTTRATCQCTDHVMMCGRSSSRTHNSKWKVPLLHRMSLSRHLPPVQFLIASGDSWSKDDRVTDRHGKLTYRGVTITAPKVKIVACKSGDATDGKKANKG